MALLTTVGRYNDNIVPAYSTAFDSSITYDDNAIIDQFYKTEFQTKLSNLEDTELSNNQRRKTIKRHKQNFINKFYSKFKRRK